MSDDVRHLVGRNVKRLRIAAGISQAKLAERIGVDRAYVSGLELGQRNPTIVTLWYIANANQVEASRNTRAPERRDSPSNQTKRRPALRPSAAIHSSIAMSR